MFVQQKQSLHDFNIKGYTADQGLQIINLSYELNYVGQLNFEGDIEGAALHVVEL